MDEVFDLRKFILMIFKKFKLVFIFAIVFGILGGAFGYIKAPEAKFKTTSAASVNTTSAGPIETTTLANVMTSVKDTVAGDYFYTGILNSIRQNVDNTEFSELFDGQKQPSLADLKNIIKIYVNGNLVLIDVITTDEALSVEAGQVGRKYIMEQLSKNINNIVITEQGQQTINASVETGDTPKKKIVKFTILGVGGGIFIALLWIFFIDIMSLKINSAEDLRKYNIPVLGEALKDRGL